ncbi:isochorismatase family protein [Mycolicibacterium pyrenivorans]|uniref:isochorismatase family protein n=1 Tax=Mycolicibacterium pyrenivorans TaxID=187102 RepID=UPI0021F37CB9|nr:isochorismatase family protein [Mycolicibacterium pyrenivorans]MCV7150796.1 isochorismatase family protein [Mycolicibacterium pyrenivorans]
MTTLHNRPHSALLVVDVQNDVVDGAHRRDDVVANIAALVERARREDVPVVWVQHSDDDLARSSHGWQIVPELSPGEDEASVEKHYGDSFEDTGLEREGAPGRAGAHGGDRHHRRSEAETGSVNRSKFFWHSPVGSANLAGAQ